MLFSLALFGVGLAAVGKWASDLDRRDREAELLRAGQEMRLAIGAYYRSSPGNLQQWPRELDELIEDRRFVAIKRHLRRLPRDPITRDHDWQAIRQADGRIVGVRSRSRGTPLLQRPWTMDDGFVVAAVPRYSDWQFTYVPTAAPGLPRTSR